MSEFGICDHCGEETTVKHWHFSHKDLCIDCENEAINQRDDELEDRRLFGND